MQRNLADNLSYYLYPDGRVTALMPDTEPLFSLKFIRDFVGPEVELACYTTDGYALFHNSQAGREGLPRNEVATSLYAEGERSEVVVSGRAFLVHPRHLDPAAARMKIR
jgi:hypothetical protein